MTRDLKVNVDDFEVCPVKATERMAYAFTDVDAFAESETIFSSPPGSPRMIVRVQGGSVFVSFHNERGYDTVRLSPQQASRLKQAL